MGISIVLGATMTPNTRLRKISWRRQIKEVVAFDAIDCRPLPTEVILGRSQWQERRPKGPAFHRVAARQSSSSEDEGSESGYPLAHSFHSGFKVVAVDTAMGAIELSRTRCRRNRIWIFGRYTNAPGPMDGFGLAQWVCSVWLERFLDTEEVAGSNPVVPTKFRFSDIQHSRDLPVNP